MQNFDLDFKFIDHTSTNQQKKFVFKNLTQYFPKLLYYLYLNISVQFRIWISGGYILYNYNIMLN